MAKLHWNQGLLCDKVEVHFLKWKKKSLNTSIIVIGMNKEDYKWSYMQKDMIKW